MFFLTFAPHMHTQICLHTLQHLPQSIKKSSVAIRGFLYFQEITDLKNFKCSLIWILLLSVAFLPDLTYRKEQHGHNLPNFTHFSGPQA